MSRNGDAVAPAEDRPRAHDVLAAALGLAAVALLAGSPWLVDRSGPEPFYKGPLVFPLIALAIMVAGSLPAVVRLSRAGRRDGPPLDGRGFPWTAAKLFVLMCGFPLALAFFGLEVATFLFAAAGLRLVGYGRPLIVLGIAACMTAIIHIAFKLVLDVWFPAPAILDLVAGAGG
ncbi:MAG: tripartite tricarboxylate transporter TctB family protein [Minwuiales bacterium]|nr:tripartite tricarboxylate transporter TctB family protein [Minwuiales bacterium]